MDTFFLRSVRRSRTSRHRQLCAFALLAAILLTSWPIAFAETKVEVYQARLSPLGVTNATVDTTTGRGSATATLTGSRVTLEITFAGLTGVATAANLRRGSKGIPGPVVLELNAPNTSSGTINATFELTPEQLKDLREARTYVQIHSERAADGSIRGWLLSAR